MTRSDILNVWYGEMLVGWLESDVTGRLSFCYEDAWVKDGFAISQQLPLSTMKYPSTDGRAHQFFVNLLPEAGARLHIIRDLKIANSDFELLKAIGGECAGALSMLPVTCEPNTTAGYKQLSDDDLKKILKRKGSVTSLTSENNRPRLSLAGAQDKIAIYFDGNNYFLPYDAAPSTHIMKFEVMGYSHIPAYEYFLTQLAASIGLPTVECHLKKHGRENFLLVKRYDRVIKSDGSINRLHQEDFCQALGIGYENKYQENGGPSFRDCYQLIQKVSTTSIHDAGHLLRWQMFNILAGNSDGHAKNLAFVYRDATQAVLAPFYDLVCTRAIERIDTKLALSIGEEFNPGNITPKHWQRLAAECDIREQYLLKVLKEISVLLIDKVVTIKEEFEDNHGPYPQLQRVQQVVLKQCKKTLKQFK